MVSRSRWVRSVGPLSIVVLAGVTFTACGDDGDDGDDGTSTDEGAAETGGEGADGRPTEAPPEAAEFCEAFDEFELTVVGGLLDPEDEAPDEAAYFASIAENFDTLADTEAPDEIADAWTTWTESVSAAYDQLASSAADADPDAGVPSEDFVSPDDDEDVVDAEMEVNAYREENCPPPDDLDFAEAEDGAASDTGDDGEDGSEDAGEGEGDGADAG